MIEINPCTLYSRKELADMLKPMGINIETFVRRLGLQHRPLRGAYLGKHILEAFDRKPLQSVPHRGVRVPHNPRTVADLVFGGGK